MPPRTLRTLLVVLLGQRALAAIDLDVWPLPQHYDLHGGQAQLVPDAFAITHTLPAGGAQAALDNAIALHTAMVFRQVPVVPYDGWMKQQMAFVRDPSTLPLVRTVRVHVEFPDARLAMAERGSEAYTLDLQHREKGGEVEAVLTAFTVWGALHGLWTFAQLVRAVETGAGGVGFVAPLVTVEDWPRFPWRGFLVDTSRHFLHKTTLQLLVDALAMNRFNVLHWHVVDSHSFPLEVPSVPELHQNGSWTSFYRSPIPGVPPATYTPEDVKEVVRYAALRGVRVVPEIDTPSHVTAWGRGVEGFIACPELHFAAHALDPTVDANFELVQKVLKDVVGLFPDQYIHLGADELNFDCWREGTGKKVAQAAKAKGKTLDDLLRIYEERVVPVAEKLGRRAVVYADPLSRGIKLPPSAIVQVWMVGGAVDMIRKVLASSHRLIISAGWYLDMQVPSLSQKQRYSFEETWRDFYNNDPVADAKLSDSEAARVLGGEVSLWAEQADDTNAMTKSFPRSSAAAERLWSSPGCGRDCSDTDETLGRLMRFRCLMVLHGIRAGPVAPDYCPYVHMFLPPTRASRHEHTAAGERMVEVVEAAVDSVESGVVPASFVVAIVCCGVLLGLLVRANRLTQGADKSK